MVNPLEKSLLDLAKTLMPEAFKPPIDPARFGDPLALRVDWGPASRGGEGMRTHRLKAVGRDRLEFRMAIGSMLLSTLVLLLGVTFVYYGVSHREDHRWWMQILAGLVLFGAGMAIFVMHRSAVFDRKSGWFYRGRKPTLPRKGSVVLLSHIHAIQILSEVCSGAKGGSFRSYEINIVLNDGTRHNVIDHGALSKIRVDAARLGQFLDVPVWDATLD
jgi:hypothetical protein